MCMQCMRGSTENEKKKKKKQNGLELAAEFRRKVDFEVNSHRLLANLKGAAQF